MLYFKNPILEHRTSNSCKSFTIEPFSFCFYHYSSFVMGHQLDSWKRLQLHCCGTCTNLLMPRLKNLREWTSTGILIRSYIGRSSLTEFVGSHNGEPIGQIKIHQIVCWKNSLLIKIGRVFPEANEIREAFIEIFVAVTDQVSPHSVASDAMRSDMQRLVVSGKGQLGLHGHKLWKGGYNIVLDSIKASVANSTNVER
jgi:hypothetical protein